MCGGLGLPLALSIALATESTRDGGNLDKMLDSNLDRRKMSLNISGYANYERINRVG